MQMIILTLLRAIISDINSRRSFSRSASSQTAWVKTDLTPLTTICLVSVAVGIIPPLRKPFCVSWLNSGKVFRQLFLFLSGTTLPTQGITALPISKGIEPFSLDKSSEIPFLHSYCIAGHSTHVIIRHRRNLLCPILIVARPSTFPE